MPRRKDEIIAIYEKLASGFTPAFLQGKTTSILRPTGRGDVMAARDYIHAAAILAEMYNHLTPAQLEDARVNCLTERDALTILPMAVSFRLKMYSPCLAYRYDELKPKEQLELWNSKDWVFTQKINGNRGILCFMPPTQEYPKGRTFLFSRNYSDVDCSLPEYWKNIYQAFNTTDQTHLKGFTALDVEILFDPQMDLSGKLHEYGIPTDSKLEAMSALLQMNSPQAIEIQKNFYQLHQRHLVTFKLIHPLYFQGVNYTTKTLQHGMQVYDKVIQTHKTKSFNLQPIDRCNGTKEQKEIFLNTIINNNGEGIVAHNAKGSYVTTDNRSKQSWVKLKRSVGAQANKQGMGDTIDGFITGFKLGTPGTANENLVSAFEVSIYLQTAKGMFKHHIANIPNITRDIQIQCTVSDGAGSYTLHPDFYNLVLEMDGQNISKQSRRLTHPRMLRVRTDKTPEMCIYTEAFINSQQD